MANLVRIAKSGADWGENELFAYNILVKRKSSHQFFGRELPTVLNEIDPLLVCGDTTSPGLSDDTFRVLQYLHVTSKAGAGQDSAVDDVAKELLRLLRYEERATLLRSRYAIPLNIRGETNRYAQTDICLVQGGMILLVVQVDKNAAVGYRNPEAQVVASAIAAFQSNNRTRSRLDLPELESMTISCITMIGTRPILYCVPVSKHLSQAVVTSQYPTEATTVTRCVVCSTSRTLNEGMEVPEFRKVALQHLSAFRVLAKECRDTFMMGM